METKTLLIVDDEEQLANLVALKAQKSGFVCVTSNSVSDASNKLSHQKFDAIILDMRLGARSGDRVISLVRDNQSSINHDIPIVVVSAFLEEKIVKEIASKVQGLFTKPVEVPKLLMKLHELCFKK